MSKDQKLWRGRGRIEYLGDPDDDPPIVIENPPEMTISDEFGEISINEAVKAERANRKHPPFEKITFKK